MFTSDNDTLAGFISFYAELAMSDTPPHGEDLMSKVHDVITPALLVHPEICKELPNYGTVKLFLEKKVWGSSSFYRIIWFACSEKRHP